MTHTIYVSPDGNDHFDGLSAQKETGGKGPFASLERARDEIRALKKQHPEAGFKVCLRGGTYYLADTFVLEPGDSGTADNPVEYCAYPGERPVLSGGRRLTGFQAEIYNEKECWTIRLDEVASGNWYFKQLFVNGLRRKRPRLPKKGFYHFTGIPAGASDPANRWLHGPDKGYFKPGDLSENWHDQDAIDLISLQQWFSSHHKIKNIDEASHVVDFQNHNIGTLKDESGNYFARYFVDNVFEALSEAGEWYLDRLSGVLRYLPMPGEDIGSAVVIAPRLEEIIRLAGNENAPVTHVVFKNIAFHHAQWQAPADFVGSVQAAFQVPGALVFEHAENCCLQGCQIAHVWQYGVEIGWGCHQCRISSCAIFDMGAGGVRIDHEWYQGKATVSKGDVQKTASGKASAAVVEDCSIHDGTLIYPGAVGIMVGNAGFVNVLRNHIYNLNYTGVSSGWTWGYAPTATAGIRIEGNHIHHICWGGPLSDNGAIYLLGRHPGGVVANNHIHHVGCHHYGARGIYPDEGTCFLKVYNNVIHDVGSGYRTHFGRGNHVFNNIIANFSESAFVLGNPEEISSGTFEHNVVFSRTGEPAANVLDKRNGLVKNCLFFQEGLPEGFAEGFSLDHWQQRGQLEGCLIQDPLFADPDGGDFSLREDSPAYSLGFKPFEQINAEQSCRTDSILAIDPEWEGESTLKLVLTNYGTAAASGTLKLVAEPPDVASLVGTEKITYQHLPPGQNVSHQIDIQILKENESYSIEIVPDDPSVNPATISKIKGEALTCRRAQAAARPAEIAGLLSAAAWQDVYEKSGELMARWKLAVAGETILFLARVHDAKQVVSTIPWEGSSVEVFLAPKDTINKSGMTQHAFSPQAGWNGAKVFRPENGAAVETAEIMADCRPVDGGYELSAIIPGASVKFPQGVNITTFLLELTIVATLQDGITLKRKRVFGAKTAHANSIGYGRVMLKS
jgi:hypothetical protein